ncbi:hypothetical protein [Altericista sp. CCNU0014]|uniref:hypothetical protein n=1 Tax=Altericista sp. CCNU0014 TaxID=3082949 RepID=UPI00384A60D1
MFYVATLFWIVTTICSSSLEEEALNKLDPENQLKAKQIHKFKWPTFMLFLLTISLVYISAIVWQAFKYHLFVLFYITSIVFFVSVALVNYRELGKNEFHPSYISIWLKAQILKILGFSIYSFFILFD